MRYTVLLGELLRRKGEREVWFNVAEPSSPRVLPLALCRRPARYVSEKAPGVRYPVAPKDPAWSGSMQETIPWCPTCCVPSVSGFYLRQGVIERAGRGKGVHAQAWLR